MNAVARVLREAKALIAYATNWTKGVAARDVNGAPTTYYTDDAVCFCALGACWRAQGPQSDGAADMLYRALAKKNGTSSHLVSVGAFNDNATHDEVLALYDDAIALAEAEQ